LAALEPWFRRHGDESPRLVNMYGITETTVHVTYRPLSWADLEAAPRSPIGVAIPDLTLHLLGSGGEPLPVGVAGEIHVGGAGLARGYLGRPELTAERFVPDPFAAWRGQPGARLYRSGDLARRLADGGLEFLGRLDHQVKIRGFRIELGEIEVALVASPGVRDAVVLVRPDRLGEMALTAYVVPAGEGATDAGALRTHLRSHLPEHMVPAGFVLLDALPLTANGKLDRKALLRLAPEADGTAGSGRAARRFVAPRTPAEEVVATIFAEVLRLDRVGVHDGFFDLGGHSLLATQVMARLRETFAVSLPLRGLFEAPTVAALAERVERARGGGITEGVVEAPPIVPVPRPHGEDGGLPLSFAQQRLWFLDRFEPGGVAYNVPLAMRLTGPLDAGTLARCLAEVVRRHEVLRTTFPERGGSPVQEIAAELPLPLPVIELGRLPEREREAEVLRLAVAQARQPFDLATGPLLRWALLRLAPEEHVMLAAAHHIVCDAWSMGVLAGELGALYAAFSRGETSPLPALPVQYADFAAWQRRWLAGARLEWELAYWRQRLAGAPQALDLPLDRPRGAVRGRRGESVPVLLSPSLNAALNELARSEGATLFMTLLSAFQALLGRWSGQDDLLVGTPVAGRGRRELEGLIGFFVNTLVLRADLAGAPSFRELLQRARTAALDAFAHQDLPFERLVEAVAPERDLSRSPLFQVMFALQNVPVEGIAMPGLTLSPIELDPGVAKFELTLALREEEGGLVGSLEYDADLFDGSTAALLLSHLTRFLEAVAADPGQKIDAVPLLVPAERQQLLANLAGGLARRTPRDTVAPAARLFVAPRTPAEEVVATIFAEVLRLERVGVHDRFFDLGGHSLLAMQVTSRLRDTFAVELPLRDLFEAPTVAALAERVERARGGGGTEGVVAAPPIVPVPRPHGEDSALPLSFAQQRLWFLDRFEPGGFAYNVPLAMRLAGPLDAGTLARCLDEVVRRHEVLRTTFAERGGSPVQVIAAELALPLPVIDLGRLPEREREAEVRRLAVAQARQPFDLAAGPLLRWALLRLASEEHVMLATAHHIVSDAWSMGVLAGELGALYAAFSRGEASPLPALPVQYADFAAWQRRWLAGARLEWELAYWRQRLAGAPRALDLPLDRPRGEVRGRHGESVPVLLSPSLTAALTELARSEGATLFMTLLSAFQALLGRWSGQDDVLVGTPVAGRSRRELEGLIGFFVNTLVLRADLAGAPPFRELLQRARVTALDAFAHQELPFEQLVEAVAPERDLSRSPLFQVMFALQNVPVERIAIPGLTLSPIPLEPGVAKFELTLALREEEGGLAGSLEYDADLFDGSTAALLLTHLTGFLEAVAADPGQKIDEVPLLVPAERQQLLANLAGGLARRTPRDTAAPAAARPFVAPRTPAEEIVAAVFAEVLRLERVGADDRFFDLGGHSLLAMQVMSRLRETLAVELPVRDLFEAPAVSALAERVERARAARRAAPVVPVPRPQGEDSGLPLSFSQQRLWFLERLAPGGVAYNVPLSTRMSGPLDAQALERALAEVVRRHEVLRTTFAERDGSPVQVIASELRVPLPLIDLGALPEPAREAEAVRLATVQARRPFDLATGPLVRWVLLRLETEEHVVLAAAHHIVSDAWSMGILVGELGALYTAFSRGEGSPLPPLPVQYADFA
ncbi:MAG TPA: condensation domain-containing protein, partial [Thermoanaerobaculia bacterium]|nr:condensation domain-containing protein [Thermoanaerobaculia bacterium]